MLFKVFEKKMNNILLENGLLKFVVIVIGIAVIINSFEVRRALKSQRTILVPANLDRKVQLQGDYASEDYIKVFARNLSNLAFTYSYGNARGQYSELLQYFTPDAFTQTKQAFNSLVETIETTKTSSAFLMQELIVNPERGTIIVKGTQRQWVDNAFVDTSQKSYQLGYKILDGRFFLTSLFEEKAAAAVAENEKHKQDLTSKSANQVQVGAPAIPATGGANAPR